MIRQGADLHVHDDSALHGAGGNNHLEIIAMLVGHYENAELRAFLSKTEAPALLEAISKEIQKRLAIRKAIKSPLVLEI